MSKAPDRSREIIRAILRPIYRPIKRFTRFILWALPTLVSLTSARSQDGRRVLIVYDTSTQPFSIGDLLIFQEASLVLCEKHGLEVVDLAIVYDPKNPGSSDPVFARRVNEENTFFHLASVLPIAQVNQRLGSVFVFNSHGHLQRYINDNADRYEVWPSGWAVASREYLSPVVLNELLHEHYAKQGSIPHLSCRPFLRSWAERFYDENVRPQVPVTVNLRNNKGWHQNRNSKIDCWIEFFHHCATRYPVVFVIICARSEIDGRLRSCANVIIAKDHDTGVEQDMALIHTSAMHMGACSGPATMAWFNSKPYLMVNAVIKPGEFFLRPDMTEKAGDETLRMWFSAPMQSLASGAESAELLIREFALMWEAIDPKTWHSAPGAGNGRTAELQTWLR